MKRVRRVRDGRESERDRERWEREQREMRETEKRKKNVPLKLFQLKQSWGGVGGGPATDNRMDDITE